MNVHIIWEEIVVVVIKQYIFPYFCTFANGKIFTRQKQRNVLLLLDRAIFFRHLIDGSKRLGEKQKLFC